MKCKSYRIIYNSVINIKTCNGMLIIFLNIFLNSNPHLKTHHYFYNFYIELLLYLFFTPCISTSQITFKKKEKIF